MKKITMGIAAMMMVFGTMTMNANNANHGKNDKKGHNITTVDNHYGNKGHNDKGHYDGWGHNDKKTFHMGHDMKKGFINVHHCMDGYKVKTAPHHHVYAREMVHGHYTGHMICVHCAKHMHNARHMH